MQCLASEKGGVMSGEHEMGWNPYLSGALSGLVIVFSVWLAGKFLGASTTFVRTAGMLESLVTPERVAAMPYFIKELPQLDIVTVRQLSKYLPFLPMSGLVPSGGFRYP
jgi:hypothetical protein